MRNLRGRLTFGVVAVLAAVLVVGGVLVARDVDRSERRVIDDRLRRTAELSRAAALAAVDRELPAADRRLDDVLRAAASSLRLSIGKTVLLEAGTRLPGTLRAPIGFSTRTIDGRRVRIYAETLRDESLGGLVRLETATGLRELERRQASLRRRLVATGVAMLLVAGLGVWLAADLVLRPLRRLRAATRVIATDDDLASRVPVGGPTELRALAGSFNEMLTRLDRSARERAQALDATRRFAADAGHELRTPLTSVQATLSAIERHPDMDPEQRTLLASDALTEQRRLVHLLDGLQALARGDANPVEHADVDLTEIVDESVQAAARRHPAITWSSQLPDQPVVARGWEPGLRLVVDNLVENAARHGRPAGTVRVTLTAGEGDAGPLLEVHDDGPGIPAAERERIFEPFVRAPTTDHHGSGLGLALVAQQAGHHAAQVTVDDSPLGGAHVSVRFTP